jgi:uncharacterized repeat protein (TIGR03803 family)
MKVHRQFSLIASAIAIVAPFAGATAATYTVLHSFAGGKDGANPAAGLLRVAGSIYGTTEYGGTGCGTIFRLNLTTVRESVVYTFNCDTVGAYPVAALIYHAGMLYGTTSEGGSGSDGAVFKYDLKTKTATNLHSFTNSPDGAKPWGGVIYDSGSLLGTTQTGGTMGHGTLFAVNALSGTEQVVHSFIGNADGSVPYAGLIRVHGGFYSTTFEGGGTNCVNGGCGSIFKYTPATGAVAIAYAFAGSGDGWGPQGGLTYARGSFYGTTLYGPNFQYPPADGGNLFKFDPAFGMTSLYSFTNPPGDGPISNLVYSKRKLYGTIALGKSGSGSIFSFDLATMQEATLYSFTGGTDGGKPFASLIDVDGALYGTTSAGGASGVGTVFKLVP